MRTILGAVIGLMLVGFCFLGGGLAVLIRRDPVVTGACTQYLDRPKEHWVKLSGCRLQIDDLLVANAEGVERFADRAEGLSRVLHSTTPVWTAVYAPVATGNPDDRRPVRVVYRLADADVLKWINAVERADEAHKKRMLDDQKILLRVASPGLLMGEARRVPEAEVLQAALGTQAQAGLLIIEPGTPPTPEWPWLALLAGLAGGAVLLWSLLRVFQRPHSTDPAAELTKVDVSDVKLSLGELDAMRQEEAEARKAGRTKGE
ncbi:MAG: hypothetical protein AB1938_05115 [Myxococcota bacterium]